MAVTSITQKFQKVTIPSNTSEHEMNFAAMGGGTIAIEWLTGTFQVSDQTITAASGTVNEDHPKMMIDINDYVTLKMKGAAGGETFNVMVLR